VDTGVLSPDLIAAETAWMKSLGLQVPEEPLLLADPFSGPLSSRSFLVPAAWHWRDPPADISTAELSRDLDFLATAMAKAYAGWETAELAGWDWRGFFGRWRARLLAQSAASLRVEDAFDSWRELMRFQLDNHSGPIPGRAFQGFSRSLLLEAEPSAPVTAWRDRLGQSGPRDTGDPAHQPRRCVVFRGGRLDEGIVISHPALLGDWEAVKAGGEWIPVREAGLSVSITNLTREVVYRRLNAEVGYVRIPTLTYLLAQQLRGDAAWLDPDARKMPVIVFDLRGNQGGAADLVFFLLQRLIGWQSIETALSFSMRIKDSCLARALTWGFAQVNLKDCRGPVPDPVRTALQQALDAVMAPSLPGCRVHFHTLTAKWTYGEHRFPSAPLPGQPRIIALTDNACGSDGEFLVYLLASLAGSVVAGVNTAGVAGFARPGHFILPNTGVPFRLATAQADLYGDQRSFEGYGLIPDIILDVDEPLGDDHLIALADSIRDMSPAQ
jgi:hypothetical protein